MFKLRFGLHYIYQKIKINKYLLLSPFHLHFPSIPLLCHIRISVLMHGLLSILTERQTTVMWTNIADRQLTTDRPW